MSVTTRVAGPEDAEAIARIYNQGIEDRVATFETEPRSPEDIRAQLASKGDRYPTVVVERDGVVVAWASAGAYRGRPAYAGGFWKLVSRIFPENVASLVLHERAGFRTVGVYARHGKLAGEWRDCVIVEKLLGEAAGASGSTPSPPPRPPAAPR